MSGAGTQASRVEFNKKMVEESHVVEQLVLLLSQPETEVEVCLVVLQLLQTFSADSGYWNEFLYHSIFLHKYRVDGKLNNKARKVNVWAINQFITCPWGTELVCADALEEGSEGWLYTSPRW